MGKVYLRDRIRARKDGAIDAETGVPVSLHTIREGIYGGAGVPGEAGVPAILKNLW